MTMGRMASLEMGGTKRWMSDNEWGTHPGWGRVYGVGERWGRTLTLPMLSACASRPALAGKAEGKEVRKWFGTSAAMVFAIRILVDGFPACGLGVSLATPLRVPAESIVPEIRPAVRVMQSMVLRQRKAGIHDSCYTLLLGHSRNSRSDGDKTLSSSPQSHICVNSGMFSRNYAGVGQWLNSGLLSRISSRCSLLVTHPIFQRPSSCPNINSRRAVYGMNWRGPRSSTTPCGSHRTHSASFGSQSVPASLKRVFDIPSLVKELTRRTSAEQPGNPTVLKIRMDTQLRIPVWSLRMSREANAHRSMDRCAEREMDVALIRVLTMLPVGVQEHAAIL
ncbi:hypothetical protein B0H13DRAFT_1860637 [Mycena leptocephala]|nr:hypothetical protein B0H13DRAFT_1860637 [Mycena leptocephala]